jgi:hypothetical protein
VSTRRRMLTGWSHCSAAGGMLDRILGPSRTSSTRLSLSLNTNPELGELCSTPS